MKLTFAPAELAGPFDAAGRALRAMRFAERLRAKDPSLWTADRSAEDAIRGRLGWLDPFEAMARERRAVLRFAEEARAEFARVLLLGMGGSSLAPEVLARTFGGAGGLPLRVLDSTDPAAVAEAEDWAAAGGRTLFLVSSKSGSTIEIDAFRRRFASDVKDPRAFAAITDPGSPLEALALQEGYRAVFRNPADVGGRFSALTLFGLVPAALIGIDIDRLSEAGRRAARGCTLSDPADPEQPGIRLGAFLAAGARAGRDKMTLLVSRRLPGLGSWIEQLVAESTGKDGKGILPVDGEPALEARAYGPDRLFVAIGCGDPDEETEARAADLERAGQPVARIALEEPIALGGAFHLWEVATATASAILGVNAFDEPNVRESKERTGALLDRYAETRALEEGSAYREDGAFRFFADAALGAPARGGSVDPVRAHLARTRPGDYVALLAFLPPTDEIAALLGGARGAILARTGAATAAGFGPRFLHSTGQLFKGGPDRGVFIQLTADDGTDMPVPGRSYSFGILKQAQA
ncbi:MAG: transaldolase, partial [Candidatus Latescibacterota bacterium]